MADADRPGCPDPIECGHEAALGMAKQQIEQLTVRLGQWSDRAIKNGERAEALEKVLEEVFSVFVPVTSDTDEDDVAGYVPLVHPRDYKRWETTLNKLKESTT